MNKINTGFILSNVLSEKLECSFDELIKLKEYIENEYKDFELESLNLSVICDINKESLMDCVKEHSYMFSTEIKNNNLFFKRSSDRYFDEEYMKYWDTTLILNTSLIKNLIRKFIE
jgi:hypothetical protein